MNIQYLFCFKCSLIQSSLLYFIVSRNKDKYESNYLYYYYILIFHLWSVLFFFPEFISVSFNLFLNLLSTLFQFSYYSNLSKLILESSIFEIPIIIFKMLSDLSNFNEAYVNIMTQEIIKYHWLPNAYISKFSIFSILFEL